MELQYEDLESKTMTFGSLLPSSDNLTDLEILSLAVHPSFINVVRYNPLIL